MDDLSLFKLESINGKKVYIVESHHSVLLPWAKVRGELGIAPNLLTLDHHTDTRPPFHRTVCQMCYAADEDDRGEFYEARQNKLLQKIEIDDEASVVAAIFHLNHDEHITTATHRGILNYAFCINLDHSSTQSIEESAYKKSRSAIVTQLDNGQWIVTVPDSSPEPQPPFTYELPIDRVFEVSSICGVGCSKMPHDDDCTKLHCDQVLDSPYLNSQLLAIQGFCNSLGLPELESAPYILDIDLDYLHTAAALAPHDHSTLYRLIRGATAITIALERGCFSKLLLDGESITSDAALSMVLEHIRRATT